MIPAHSRTMFESESDMFMSLATGLRSKFQAAQPFPHVVIDDFLPEPIARAALDVFPDLSQTGNNLEKPHKGDVVKGKFATQGMPPGYEDLFEAFLSGSFLCFLESLTGVQGLHADRALGGAGLHEIIPGGHLKVHVDYNIYKQHEHPMLRKVNLLYFLNQGWQEEWGGHLELWSQGQTSPDVRILPIFNRCVIFESSDHSYHGHPHPLSCPSDQKRRSIAFYYFVELPDPLPRRHSTIYIET